MRWLMTAQLCRYHRCYPGSQYVWQGRFKAFAIQNDAHDLTVMRIIERNPLRANLVEQSQDFDKGDRVRGRSQSPLSKSSAALSPS